jgi:hypothetical protein
MGIKSTIVPSETEAFVKLSFLRDELGVAEFYKAIMSICDSKIEAEWLANEISGALPYRYFAPILERMNDMYDPGNRENFMIEKGR